jgi:hypothetical protein
MQLAQNLDPIDQDPTSATPPPKNMDNTRQLTHKIGSLIYDMK